MARNPNSNVQGGKFDQATINQVWKKGNAISGYDPGVWRYDMCGMPMKYEEHGNTGSKYGWEVDHIRPVAQAGSDQIVNLQPLQWANNRKKGDVYPWSCN